MIPRRPTALSRHQPASAQQTGLDNVMSKLDTGARLAPALTTIAVRVCRMDEMVAFYSQAFDAVFRPVDTFGLTSRFGEVAGVTLKFVPLRDATDFDGYPLHQLGFEVTDVHSVLRLAVQHGGRQEGEMVVSADRVHASVRVPDGNTLELYGPVPTG